MWFSIATWQDHGSSLVSDPTFPCDLFPFITHHQRSNFISLFIPHLLSAKMARKMMLILALTCLCIGLAAADWNILNPIWNINARQDSLKNYCESWRINVELNNIREFDVVPQECVAHIKKYMTSSQYDADCQRAIEEVTLYLSRCCSLKGDGKDAWIFDVDDTLISTIPYFKKHGFG